MRTEQIKYVMFWQIHLFIVRKFLAGQYKK